MRATVTFNSRGTVTLPAKLRNAMGLKGDNVLIAETTPERILLRPAAALPLETYSAKRIREFDAGEADLARVQARKRSR